MTFKYEDMLQYQQTTRTFFALLPRKTITGWAWLIDLKKIQTVAHLPEKTTIHNHFEKLWDPNR